MDITRPRLLTGFARPLRGTFRHELRLLLRQGQQIVASDRGLMEIVGHEAIVLSPYWDSVRVLTIWIGHTRAAGAPDPATMWGRATTIPQALDQYRRDIARYEARVRAAFTRPLTQPQFDGALSFDLNTGAIATATWVRLWNAGDLVGARKSFMTWVKPKEITARRAAECALFFGDTYSGNGMAPLYPANGNGVIDWAHGKLVDLRQYFPARAA